MIYAYEPSALHPGVEPQVFAATFTPVGTEALRWAAMDQKLAVLDMKVPEGPEGYVLQNLLFRPDSPVQLFGIKTYWESVESMLLSGSEMSVANPKVRTKEPVISDKAACILVHTMTDKRARGQAAHELYKELQARRLACESHLGIAACGRLLTDEAIFGPT